MHLKIKIILILLLLPLSVMAEEKLEEEEKFIEKIDSGSLSKITNLSSDLFNKSYIENTSFYFDITVNKFLPNLKLEYNDGYYNSKKSLNSESYINDNISFIDMNLQYGDIVSYYTIKNEKNLGVNFGFGLRQYVGNIEYNQNEVEIQQDITSTIPLTYMDLFYELKEKKSYVGTFIKESEFANENIKDYGIYLKSNIRYVDNLSTIVSYSTSSVSFFANNYSGKAIDSEGLNFQLKYIY